MTSFAEAFKDAYNDENVQKAFSAWNTFRDTQSNIFSTTTQDAVSNSKIIPDSIKSGYSSVVDKANDLTGGLISSNVLTKGLRYQKVINKGIDVGLSASEKIATKMNEFEDNVNEKIDDKLEELQEERDEKENDRASNRELPTIKEVDDSEEEYIPGKLGRYLS